MVRDERLRRQKRRSGQRGGVAKSKQTAKQNPGSTKSNRLAKRYTSSSSSSSTAVSEDTTYLPLGAKGSDSILDAVMEMYYPTIDRSRVSNSLAREITSVVQDLTARSDCTPAEMELRRSRLRREWGDKADTARSLATHWDKYARLEEEKMRW